MNYDTMRRRLNSDQRLSYEQYLSGYDYEVAKRKKEEELYCQARLRLINAKRVMHEDKIAREIELFENVTITEQKDINPTVIVAMTDIDELKLLYKNMREEIELLKKEIEALKKG